MKIAWIVNPPSFVETPFGRLWLTGMFGLQGRGWFFGLQTASATPPQPSAAESETQ